MRTPWSYLRGIRHPEAFHGRGVHGSFFEGWYIKLVSRDLRQRWAVIPGIFLGLEGATRDRDEAFVQVLDGLTGRSWYHAYPIEEFWASDSAFSVGVGRNHFSPSGVTLDLPQLSGRIEFTSPMDPWPFTWRRPGIMGWYGLVPFMECFHGIVSFGHGLAGVLEVEGRPSSFEAGRGYIEKDWGRAFPAGYVWLHSNHIDGDPQASLVASAAIIPWIRRAFRGFIVGYRHSGKLHRWTTYDGSNEERLSIDDTHVRWEIDGPDGRLELTAERARGGLLHAPLRTAMHRRVEETLDATIFIRHLDSDGEVLAEGVGNCAAMEVFGDIERLLAI